MPWTADRSSANQQLPPYRTSKVHRWALWILSSAITYLQKTILLTYFDVSLTVHLSITLDNDQLNAQIFNTFITILYMFRAISCSSSGGQIVLTQHLASSLSVSDRPVHRLS
jgi:hypothetical protein